MPAEIVKLAFEKHHNIKIFSPIEKLRKNCDLANLLSIKMGKPLMQNFHCRIWGHVQMTSAQRGGLAQNLIKAKEGCMDLVLKRGGGGQKSR